jgi:hypothetical protein
MEQILALAAFGMLGAITIAGFLSTERGARERNRLARRDPDGANRPQSDE